MVEPISTDRALLDELVTVVKRDELRHLYWLRFGVLYQIVKFQLVRIDGQLFDCDQSHYLRTKCHGLTKSAHTRDFGAGQTLYNGIHRIVSDYRLAVRDGEVPCEDWLRPYEHFGEMSAAYLSNTKTQQYWIATGRYKSGL